MSEKLKLKVSQAVAAIVHSGVDVEEKLRGVESFASMPPVDQVLLLFCLMRDKEELIKGAATVAFSSLSTETLVEYIRESQAYPAVLDAIARQHYNSADVVAALLDNDALTPQAAGFLQRFSAQHMPLQDLTSADTATPEEDEDSDEMNYERSGEDDDQADGADDSEEEESDDLALEDEEFLSKYKMAQIMGIAEKIKMALSGDKEWRAILVKDANKLVSGSVIKNPRITEAEVLALVKSGVQNDEIMRLICSNKEWIKNYKIRKALVENPRTPVQNALRYLSSLGDKDIAGYAKSKNISSVISTQAKRLLLNKKR